MLVSVSEQTHPQCRHIGFCGKTKNGCTLGIESRELQVASQSGDPKV